MPNPALDNAGPVVEKFAATGGRMLGYVAGGLLLAVAVGSAISDPVVNRQLALGCAAFALLSWVSLVRPVAAAHAHGLVLRNMIRDIYIPWSQIERCKVNQTLQVATSGRQFHGLGVSRSARSVIRGEKTIERMQMRRPGFLGIGGTFGGSAVKEPSRRANQEAAGGSYTDYIESRILDLARRGKKAADPGSAVVAWDWLAVAALGAAVMCLGLIFI